MGLYRVVLEATGGHGCQREIEPGKPFFGCRRQDCPDCVTQEYVEKMKSIGQHVSKAELIHWPNAAEWGGQTITDTFIGPIRRVESYEEAVLTDGKRVSTGKINHYVDYMPIHRIRDKKF